MPDDLLSYFRKKIAKPFSWEVAGRKYRIEIISIEDDEVSAALNELDDRGRGDRYLGEGSIRVLPTDSREEVLDQIAVLLDDALRTTSDDARVLSARAALDGDVEDREKEETDAGYEPGGDDVRVDVGRLQAPTWEDVEAADGMDPEGKVSRIREEMPTGFPFDPPKRRTSKTDTYDWIKQIDAMVELADRLRTADAGLFDIWSRLPKGAFLPPRRFYNAGELQTNLLLLLQYRIETLMALDRHREAFESVTLYLKLDPADTGGLVRPVHAALCVLNDVDRNYAETVLEIFERRYLQRYPVIAWTRALLHHYVGATRDGKSPEDVLRAAHAANSLAAELIVTRTAPVHDVFGLTQLDAVDTAGIIAGVLMQAWHHVCDPGPAFRRAGIRI